MCAYRMVLLIGDATDWLIQTCVANSTMAKAKYRL